MPLEPDDQRLVTAAEGYLELGMYLNAYEEKAKIELQGQLQPEVIEVSAKIFRHLVEIAESSGPEVWHALGGCFQNGSGTERSREDAIRWYYRSARAGHIRSMVRLGLILQHTATPTTHLEAVDWFRKAADLRDPSGMVFLGFAYREGRGVTSDPAEAARWFIKAADAGDNHAMVLAGRLYAGELAMPAETLKCLHRAAESGQTESYISLAMLYDDRSSGMYDPVEAVKWYRAVVNASRGHLGRAMLALARHARDGVGVPCDLGVAKGWLHRLLRVESEHSTFRKEATRLLKEIEGDLL